MACSVDAVDIVVPTYLRSSTLGRALDSIIAQEGTLVGNVIVPDNGDDDATLNVIAEYSERIPRLQHLRWGENIGAINNWKRGLECAQSEWVVVLWSDDELTPSALVDLTREAGPEIGSISGQATIKTEQMSWSSFADRRLTLDFSGVVEGLLQFSPNLPASPAGSLVRRQSAIAGLERVDYNPECLRRAIGPDVGLFYWAVAAGRTHIHLPSQTAIFHGGADSITMNTDRRLRSACYVSAMLRTARAAGYSLTPSARRLIRHRVAMDRLMKAPKDVVESEGRLAPTLLTADAYRIARQVLALRMAR